MKHIVKNPEPQAFMEWKQHHQAAIERKTQDVRNMDVVWNLLPSKLPKAGTDVGNEPLFSKEELRHTLLEEQGYICCYCTRSVSDDHKTKLEHFLPKEKDQYPNHRFTYETLLACCNGGEKDTDKPRETYCDSKKGSKDPTNPTPIVSPFEPDCEAFFEFDEMGKIHPAGENERAAYTISFLGLNARALNKLRGKAINTYILDIWAEDMDTAAETAFLQKKDTVGRFQPFCTAIVSVLRHYP